MLGLIAGGQYRDGDYLLCISVLDSTTRGRHLLVELRRVGEREPVAEWWFDSAGRRIDREQLATVQTA